MTSERVVLKRNWVGDVAHVETVVQREQLRVETEGQQVSMISHPDNDAAAHLEQSSFGSAGPRYAPAPYCPRRD